MEDSDLVGWWRHRLGTRWSSTHPSGRAATPRLLVENIPEPSPVGYDCVAEVECIVSILRWLEAFALGCCKTNSRTWGLEEKIADPLRSAPAVLLFW